MINAGIQPINYSSTLTGLSQKIYNNMINSGAIKPESTITQTVGDTTFTERESDRQTRVFQSKCMAWSSAQGVVDEMKTNAQISIGGGQTVSNYVAGVGTSGDSLIATTYPVVGSVKTPTLGQLTGTLS